MSKVWLFGQVHEKKSLIKVGLI